MNNQSPKRVSKGLRRYLRIGAIAQATGLHPPTIRNLERRKLIAPARDWSGERRFAREDVAAICALITRPAPSAKRRARGAHRQRRQGRPTGPAPRPSRWRHSRNPCR